MALVLGYPCLARSRQQVTGKETSSAVARLQSVQPLDAFARYGRGAFDGGG
jgi:hypothetical protein